VVRQAIYLHELAHALGLGHVNDRSQLMNPTVSVYRFGRGDLAGLARLGGYMGCLSAS
jgi:predicted Zn-dependent protease